MQDRWGGPDFAVLGVTASDTEAARTFLQQYDGNYPALADGQATLDAWGVDMVWGNAVYLVDPDGRVVAEDMEEAQGILEATFNSALDGS